MHVSECAGALKARGQHWVSSSETGWPDFKPLSQGWLTSEPQELPQSLFSLVLGLRAHTPLPGIVGSEGLDSGP